ncbi:hypothetical protein B4168_1352 [Anoxybacillus flavithermus]|nr:hypothetical protein B4168_1352 [Anoxybacillus flavithermus]OAO83615.1 hypothetical protein GT23_4109 [Parageobacillus thermoglucosidasius]
MKHNFLLFLFLLNLFYQRLIFRCGKIDIPFFFLRLNTNFWDS